MANNALINPSLITYDAGTGEHTITGLTQAQLDNFQILHEGTAGRVSIEVDARTYEVKTATGAVVAHWLALLVHGLREALRSM